jgi:AraC-like DNA-binding protein
MIINNVIQLSMPEHDLLSDIGYLRQKSVRETYSYHTHDFFEFFFVLNGKAIHLINGEKQVISKGSFVFIRPKDAHQYNFINDYDMELLSLGVSNKIMKETCQYLGIKEETFITPKLPNHISFEGSDYWKMSEALLQIDKKEPGLERRRYFMSLLPNLLYQILYSKNKDLTILPIWLSALLEEMNKQENYIAGLSRMLDLSDVSREHLTREFRRFLGISPTEFINIKRMNYASDLLLKRKYGILDICYMSGYNNVSYFYKVFEKIYHCTPKEFVKEFGTSN